MTTMQTARGAIISDEDWDVVLNFLVKHHGRVNVNRATADDLIEVLGVTPEVAENIVKYRKEHGNFEDFDGFAKVPGSIWRSSKRSGTRFRSDASRDCSEAFPMSRHVRETSGFYTAAENWRHLHA